MKSWHNLGGFVGGGLLVACLGGFWPASARVLDDFNAAQASGWEDSNPAGQPLPGGKQANGVFTFDLPAVGQPYFVASTKKTETFELKEGRNLEFRVDMVSALGPDSYAVLAFIPTTTGANSLAGYGLAKSETDFLITKGINKYFLDDVPSPALKNQNVTLTLNLTVRNGNVEVTGQVLDKDDGNRVIYEKRVVDTPAADIMSDGTDDPPAPFITTGYFVLYLYADNGTEPAGYQVVYDNAEVLVCDATVLDDFNAAQATGWEDSNPAGLPLPGGKQANGVFTFDLQAIGQPYFVASTKKTKTFQLDEGTRHEFAVDMVSGLGIDSFTVLAFIPSATGANSLGGYGIAKSESDLLITKGINKYFFNENVDPPVKNQNVTLVLTLTVLHGNVVIRGRVLDKDDNNAVLFDKTFVDTPAADVMADGDDDPPAPFVGMPGNVVLYLYADGGQDPAGYQVVYDNLLASTPPSDANEAPVILEVTPKAGTSFLTAPTTLSFKVSDDKPIADSGVSVRLNGQLITTANGLTLNAAGTTRVATLSGLGANTNYVAELTVVDSDNVTRSETTYFDTFLATDRVAEIEDYNFDSGQYFNNPVRTPEGWGQADNSYVDRMGVEGTDFHDTRTAPSGNDTLYRTQDPVRMAHTLDQRRPQFDPDNFVFDYDVGDLVADEWLNYTRDFTAGSYEVYLREAVVNFAQADSVLELVTGNASQPNQTTSTLGTFFGKLSGYTFRNVPLTDGTGLNKVVLKLSGKTTLRLRQVTGDTDSGNRYLNYLIFVPVSDTGVQRAAITSLTPTPSSTVQTVTPEIEAVIQNRDTSVDTATIQLEVNGQTVTPTITPTASGATVSWAMSPLPASGAANTAKLTFKDNQAIESVTEWSFVVTYIYLDPANRRSGPGQDAGFQMRMVQAPAGSNLDNSLDRAEAQLAPNSTIPVYVDTNFVEQVVNMSQDGAPAGNFPDKYIVPGLDEFNGTDDFVVEVRAWLELSAGVHRFGVVSDDGYKISSGSSPSAKEPVLAFHNGGPANETFDFVVPQAGFYPFRLIWYERGGSAYAEWFSQDPATGENTLINDSTSAKAVKAYQNVAAEPAVTLQFAERLGDAFADESAAVINTATKTITTAVGGSARFYRLRSDAARTLKTIAIQGGNVVMTYE